MFPPTAGHQVLLLQGVVTRRERHERGIPEASLSNSGEHFTAGRLLCRFEAGCQIRVKQAVFQAFAFWTGGRLVTGVTVLRWLS